jgi:hypothetical protein
MQVVIESFVRADTGRDRTTQRLSYVYRRFTPFERTARLLYRDVRDSSRVN